MPSPIYRYFYLLTRRQGGSSLGQFPANLDLGPAVEWGRFTALRCWSDPDLAAEAEPRVAPIWHATSGQPYVEGLRVTVRARAMPTITADIPRSFFKSNAMRLGDTLVKQKQLQPGELFFYAVLAFPAAADRAPQSPDPLEVEEVPVPVRLAPGSLSEELERSTAFGDVGPGLLPVFVPERVMDEVFALTERAGQVEVGAVLIGNIHQDAASKQLFLKVTAQIPARHAISESSRLGITPETWAAVQAALDLRQSGEQMVGWFHSHPARHWCKKECSPEAKKQCPFATPFFSRTDCDLHRIAFSQAHCIALLVSDTFSGMIPTMYSWDRAEIVQRGFHISKPDPARALPVPAAVSTIGSNIYETSCKPS